MGTPSWTDNNCYDYLDGLDAPGWAFEFLRRGTTYRQAYTEWHAIQQRLLSRPGPVWLRTSSDPLGWIFEPPRAENESIPAWQLRVRADGLEPRRTWYSDHFASRFCMTPPLLDPERPADRAMAVRPGDFPLVPDAITIKGYFIGDDSTSPFEPSFGQCIGFATIIFDLRKSLAPQFTVARTVLRARQAREAQGQCYAVENTKNMKLRRDRLRLLLRVLDAKATGAKHGAIAAVLLSHKKDGAAYGYGPTKDVHDLLKSARKYVKSDYRVIAGATLY